MWHRVGVAILAGVVLVGCGARDPVVQLVDDCVEAAEERDATALLELLAADFSTAEGADRESAAGMARQMLALYRALDVDVSGLEVNRRGDSARATFRLTMDGVTRNVGGMGDLVPRRAVYDFEITARDDGGTWKLVTASWKEAGSSS